MTTDERELLIRIMVMFGNKTENYFKSLSDNEIESEYDRMMNND